MALRALGSTSVNALIQMVGRPGLDPGTLALRGTRQQLRCVGLVVHVVCFQGITLPNRYVAPRPSSNRVHSSEDDLSARSLGVELAYGDDVLHLFNEVVLLQAEQLN